MLIGQPSGAVTVAGRGPRGPRSRPARGGSRRTAATLAGAAWSGWAARTKASRILARAGSSPRGDPDDRALLHQLLRRVAPRRPLRRGGRAGPRRDRGRPELGIERSLGSMLAGNAAEPMLARGEWDRASRMITPRARARPADPASRAPANRSGPGTSSGRAGWRRLTLCSRELRRMIGPRTARATVCGRCHSDRRGVHARPRRPRPGLGRPAALPEPGGSRYYAPLVFPVLAVGSLGRPPAGRSRGVAISTPNRSAAIFASRSCRTRIRERWEPVTLAELSDSTRGLATRVRPCARPQRASPSGAVRGATAGASPHRGHRPCRSEGGAGQSNQRAEDLGAGLLIDRLQTLARQLGLASTPAPASAGLGVRRSDSARAGRAQPRCRRPVQWRDREDCSSVPRRHRARVEHPRQARGVRARGGCGNRPSTRPGRGCDRGWRHVEPQSQPHAISGPSSKVTVATERGQR